VNNNSAFGAGSVAFEGVNPIDSTAIPLGAIQAFGSPRTLANSVQYQSDANFVGSQTLSLNGAQDLAGRIVRINTTNSADTMLGGVVSNGGIQKLGSGQLVLAGSNSYTGQTLVDAGTLLATSNNALGGNNSAPTFVRGTGALVISSVTGITMPGESVIFSTTVPTNPISNGNLRNASGNNVLGGILGVDDTALVGVDPGGTLTFGNYVLDNTGTSGLLSKVGAGQLNVKAIRLPVGGMNIAAGTVGISANGTDAGASKVGTISIAGGSALDLADNDLVVTTTPGATVQTLIKSARDGGAWDQSGITSSAARNEPNHATGLGLMSGAEYTAFAAGTGTFSGQAYAGTDTLVKYTWNGDTNFSGKVNFDDYVRVDIGFNTGLTGWVNGDFNYSGSVNFDDYVLIDIAFNVQSGTLARAIEYIDGSDRSQTGLSDGLRQVAWHFDEFGQPYAQAFLAAIPEPTIGAIGGAVVTAAGLLAGRRSRRPQQVAS
jgi:autotransporter-associated beta strand protein